MQKRRFVYRVHLDVPIDENDWKDLKDAMKDEVDMNKKKAYETVVKNIDSGNQSETVKSLIAMALGHKR